MRLIDFQDADNNAFYVVTQMSCVIGDNEFRPNITLFISGMPLAFVDVKKPNNRDGTAWITPGDLLLNVGYKFINKSE